MLLSRQKKPGSLLNKKSPSGIDRHQWDPTSNGMRVATLPEELFQKGQLCWKH